MKPRNIRNTTTRARRLTVATIAACILAAATAHAEDWPQWRGPRGTGVGIAEDLPATWGPEQNIVWKTAMPSWSGSSPIVVGDRVLVMSPSEAPPPGDETKEEPPAGEGRRRGRRNRTGPGASGGPGGPDIVLLCLSRDDGSVLWRRVLDSGNQFRMKHNSSSPSPVSDGKHVWAVTGNGVVVAHSLAGEELWRFDIHKTYGPVGTQFGYASSPLLHNGVLYLQVLHGMKTTAPSYVFALDAATGKVRWRRERPTDAKSESPDAYTSPAVVTLADGAHQIVISGANFVTGHAPDSGAEVWRAGGLNPRDAGNYRIVASPVVTNDMIFAPSRRTPLLALRAGGQGDITQSHLAWKWDQPGSPDVPTPVCDGTYLYMADDRGQLTCVEVKTGRPVWGPTDLGIGSVSASPVLADGKLFIVNETGQCAVVAAGDKYQPIARNDLDGSFTLSTPAAAGRRLFIRTATHLYCIGKPAQ